MGIENFTQWTNVEWCAHVTALDCDGAALDLTGASALMNIKAMTGATVLELSLGDGLTIVDAIGGMIDIGVPQYRMGTIPPNLYVYDLIVNVGEIKHIVSHGSVHIRKGITEWTHAVGATMNAAAGLTAEVARYAMGINFQVPHATKNSAAIAVTSLLTCTRATSGWAEREDASLIEFDPNELRITDKGLLVEEARTNLFLNSFVPVTQTLGVLNATKYTISLKGTGNIVLSGAGIGTVTEGTSVMVTTTSTSLACTINGTVTHVNVEQAASASSFIETGGVAATRAADEVQFADLSWLNTHTGTLLLTGQFLDTASTGVFKPGDGTNANRYQVYRSSNGKITTYIQAQGVYQTSMIIGPLITENQLFKAAFAYDNGGVRLAAGGSVISDTITTEPVLTTLELFPNMLVKSVVGWPVYKSEVELQGMTG